jgi:hypothetical protein
MLRLAEAAGSRGRRGSSGVCRPIRARRQKLASLVAGMIPGADSIDNIRLLRHGGMGRVFERSRSRHQR